MLAGYKPVGFKTTLNFSFDLHIFNLKHSNLFLHALIRIKSTYVSNKYFIKQLLYSIIHVDTKLCETVNYIVPSLCYRIRFNWVEFNCFVFTLHWIFTWKSHLQTTLSNDPIKYFCCELLCEVKWKGVTWHCFTKFNWLLMSLQVSVWKVKECLTCPKHVPSRYMSLCWFIDTGYKEFIL